MKRLFIVLWKKAFHSVRHSWTLDVDCLFEGGTELELQVEWDFDFHAGVVFDVCMENGVIQDSELHWAQNWAELLWIFGEPRRPRGMTELDVNCKNHVAHVVGFVFGAARNGCEPRRPRGIADED